MKISNDNTLKIKQLNESYHLLLDDMIQYMDNHYSNELKANILLSYILDNMIAHQNKVNNPKKLYNNLKDYIYKIDKSINYKKHLKEYKEHDINKYTINCLWITMCGYIVILFIKELLRWDFLIHFYVDLLIGIIAFYVVINNLLNAYKIIKRYQIGILPFSILLLGLLVSILTAIITIKSPFDITFLILVIAFITSKKIINKKLGEQQNS